MRNLYLVLTALALLAASPASAMKGPQVPLSASSASSFTVQVSGGGGTGDSVQTSGLFPLTLPFNLSGSACMASGTATFEVVNGRIELDIANGALTAGPTACQLHIVVQYDDLTFTVPDVGDAVVGASFVIFGRPELFRIGASAPRSTLTAASRPAESSSA